MFEALYFLGGMVVGGLFGVVIMCLFQINRLHDKEDEE